MQRVSTQGTSGLIGPGTDGVYYFNGSEPVPVLDDWERLLKGGVNRGRLDDAVSAVSFTKNLYFLAVPSHGSEVNDRVLVFDFARKNWWVWSSPHGVSFMATDYDEAGKETVLFGTNDGHIQVLTGSLTDDGQVISSHASTLPVAPFGDRESSFIAKQEADQKPVENMMDKAVSYLKASEDKQQAYDNIIKKYGDQLTDKQKAGLKKFVR